MLLMIFFWVIYPDKNNLFLLLFIENIDIDILLPQLTDLLQPLILLRQMFWRLNFAYLSFA